MGRVVQTTEEPLKTYQLSAPRVRLNLLEEPVALPAQHGALELTPDLDMIVTESSRLVDQASSDAYAIIDSAHRRAQQLLVKAHDAVEELEQRARTDGAAVGRAEALALIEDELRSARETMQSIVASALAQRHQVIEAAEKEIIRLSYALAERIVHEQIAHDPEVVVCVARAAIKRLVERDRVTIRVNAQDLDRMRAHREDMLALGDIREVRVIADARVDHGGVIFETESGMIDARIATQLEEAQRVLGLDETDESPVC